MQSAIIVAVVSVIPGLGFVLLRQYKRSLAIVGVFIVLFLVALFFQKTFISQLAFSGLFLLWIAQIIFAFQIAQSYWQTQNGNLQTANQLDSRRIYSSSHKLTSKEAGVTLSRNIAYQQIPTDDRLLKAILARTRISKALPFLTGPAAVLSQSWYCVAVSSLSGLTMIQLDFMFKPIGVKRYPFTEIINASYESGWQRDKMDFVLQDGKILELEVMKVYQAEAKAITSIFRKSSNLG